MLVELDLAFLGAVGTLFVHSALLLKIRIGHTAVVLLHIDIRKNPVTKARPKCNRSRHSPAIIALDCLRTLAWCIFKSPHKLAG